MDNALIKYLQLYKSLPLSDQEIIADAFTPRSFKEGDHLFRGGAVCRELFFVCTGVLRIVRLNEKGNEVTHFFLKENQFCSILNSFNNQVPVEESIQAACDTAVLSISRGSLLSLYEKLPYLKELLTSIMQQSLLDKIAIKNMYMGEDSTTRYRLFIMRQPEIALRVPMSAIASYLGITPQSLSRIRRSMR